MKKMFFLVFLIQLTGIRVIAQHANTNDQRDVDMFIENVFNLSETMVNDVTPPATASRYYAYAILGAYEVALMGKQKLPDFNTKFKTNPGIQPISLPKDFDVAFCSNYAMLEIARRMMPQGFGLLAHQNTMVKTYESRKKLSAKAINNNIEFAKDIAEQIIQYSRTDGYSKISTYPRYTPKKKEGFWRPTPPAFLGAADAHWGKIRTFFLDSATQFQPPAPTPFSTDTSSAFYKLAYEVYSAGKNLTEDQTSIANFWDCNPFSLKYSGHMEIGMKKISPGGHWLGITGIACKNAGVKLDTTILVFTGVALTLHDAFVTCWYQKFHHQRLRPESYINRYIDPSWRPLLQTPPFPDYLSGHSTVSPVAASILSHFFGEHTDFIDTSEEIYGLAEKHFESFRKAAKAASISRGYGGIHFRDACEEGYKLGTQIGDYLVSYLFDPLTEH